MRIGNAVGTAPFKNTNRKNPAYRRKKDRIARRNGFLDAVHQATFLALLAAGRPPTHVGLRIQGHTFVATALEASGIANAIDRHPGNRGH